MNIEIKEVANGWMIRPRMTGGGGFLPDTELWVFNNFEDMTAYLRSISPILKSKP